MNIEDLKSVNSLWARVYPYLAGQVMRSYRRTEGNVLELGSFAGGISFELAEKYAKLRLTIADERADYLQHLRNELYRRGLSSRIKLVNTDLDSLSFPGAGFDLVILRGAFFFIMARPQILDEIYRVLRPGGLGFVGGGYGAGIPQAIIDEIAGESRVLNDRLGRHRVSLEELKSVAAQAGIAQNYRITEEGGVWLEILK